MAPIAMPINAVDIHPDLQRQLERDQLRRPPHIGVARVQVALG
jgi:hypothetical protein